MNKPDLPQILVIDTCVLISNVLRRLLLRLAEQACFRPAWSSVIGDEWQRNAARLWGVSASDVQTQWLSLQADFPWADQGDITAFKAGLRRSDPKDWHVIAAARAAKSRAAHVLAAGVPMAGTPMAGTSMAGTSMAGTSMAGTSMAGTSMAGTSMAGTSMAGTSMAGPPAASAATAGAPAIGVSAGIVTRNIKDFNRTELRGYGLALLDPDEVLVRCLQQYPRQAAGVFDEIPNFARAPGRELEAIDVILKRERLFRLNRLYPCRP